MNRDREGPENGIKIIAFAKEISFQDTFSKLFQQFRLIFLQTVSSLSSDGITLNLF